MKNFPKICVYNIILLFYYYFFQKRAGRTGTHLLSNFARKGSPRTLGTRKSLTYIISDDFRCALVSAVKNDEARIGCVTKFQLVVVQT